MLFRMGCQVIDKSLYLAAMDRPQKIRVRRRSVGLGFRIAVGADATVGGQPIGDQLDRFDPVVVPHLELLGDLVAEFPLVGQVAQVADVIADVHGVALKTLVYLGILHERASREEKAVESETQIWAKH